MNAPAHKADLRPIRQARRALRAGAAAVAVATGIVATAGGAYGAFSMMLDSPANSISAAAVPAGNQPTATVLNTDDVELDWAPTTIPVSQAVDGYLVFRHQGPTSVPATGGCAGVVTATTCTEADVPIGVWQYGIQPKYKNWTGPESPRVTIEVFPTVTTNGSFEAALDGWSASPAGLVTATSSHAGHTAVDGTHFALLTAGATGVDTTLSQSVTVAAGQVLTGSAFFDCADPDPLGFNDAGAVLVGPSGVEVSLFSRACSPATSEAWQSFTHTFTTAGTYVISANVRNVGDGSFPSYLGFDNILIS